MLLSVVAHAQMLIFNTLIKDFFFFFAEKDALQQGAIITKMTRSYGDRLAAECS